MDDSNKESVSMLSKSPRSVKRLLSVDTTKDKKIEILRTIKKEALAEVEKYKAKYRKTKKIDDAIDAGNALLTGTSISLTVIGLHTPPLLIVSASVSGFSFIMSRIQDKINFKAKYLQHHQTFNNYSQLAREIITVLNKNNLSSEEYLRYIQEVYDKLGLIEDSQLF